MFNAILPESADNTFRGYKAALWILGLLLLVRAVIALRSLFDGHTVATSADGLALSTFTLAGSETIVLMFAMWGLAQLVISFFGAVVLIRYRALTSLVYAALLVELLGRKAVGHFMPIAGASPAPASWVNVALLVLTIVGFSLSLIDRNVLAPTGAGSAAEREQRSPTS